MNKVKTKNRISEFGEVFTNEREVNAMIDLVKQEVVRVESRFLEPACGDGNFLIEVLRRKLEVVKNRYSKNLDGYEKYSVLAISSIYGVEILQDNVEICKLRLFDYWNREYTNIFKKQCDDNSRISVKYILDKNILNGDALTLKQANGEPIIFSEWSSVNGVFFKRREYRLDEMIEGHQEQISIFMDEWEYDNEIKAFIPKPIREYPPVHFKKVNNYE